MSFHACLLFAVATFQSAPGDTGPEAQPRLTVEVVDDHVAITDSIGSAGARPWRLRLTAWGRACALQTVEAGVQTHDGDSFALRRGDLTEWYVNDGRGLEQGFDVLSPPDVGGAPETSPLELVLDLDDDVTVTLSADARSAHLRRAVDATELSYSGLFATDAAGRELDARLQAQGHQLSIVVDDAGAVYPLTIDPWITIFQGKLIGDALFPVTQVGRSVAISGNTAVCGGLTDAYVFVRSGTTWSQEARLLGSDAGPNDWFGSSVAIDGDTVVIGAPLQGPGSAYVFTRNGTTWTEQAKLAPSDTNTGIWFGADVAVSADTIVAGAVYANSSEGAAYVFVRSGTSWTEETKLTAAAPFGAEWLGNSVAIDGDTVVAGALAAFGAAFKSGAAYVFVRNNTTWNQEAKLIASDGASWDRLGESVSLHGDTAVLSARGKNVSGSLAGSAYVFTRNATVWTEAARLNATNTTYGGSLGWSVTNTNTVAVVGAMTNGANGAGDYGSAYVFARGSSSWNQVAHIEPADAMANHFFGFSVGLSGNTLVVGAMGDEEGGGYQAGASYVYTLSPLSIARYCAAGVSTNGCVPQLSWTGTPSATAGSGFLINATGVEGQKQGLFFYGISGPISAPWGSGSSFLCVKAPTQRMGMQSSGGTASACDGVFGVDWNAYIAANPTALGNPFNAGSLVYVQAWYRDPPAPKTTNLSDALEFSLEP